MSDSPHIIDINADNFEAVVMNGSQETLVMLDFWATWCGPCQSLIPVISKLAEEFNGAFILAKVDIDQNQDLAATFGVRSVPTVKFIKQGQVVDEFTGALPETEIRTFLDKHIERASDKLLDAAIAQYEAGETDQAITAIQDISQVDPHNPRLPLVYAELMIREGKHEQAKEVLQSLSREGRESKHVAAMLAKIEFAATASNMPSEDELLKAVEANPKDSQARHQLGTLYTMQGEYEKALDQLIELVKTDRKYDDDAGRKAMLKIFDMLGDHELVHRYRRKMMAALY